MFKNETEFAVAMAEGRVFKDPLNAKYYMQITEDNRRRFVVEHLVVERPDHSPTELQSLWNAYNDVTEVLPWEKNIPEHGIPCWVWDNESDKQVLDIIEGYDPDSDTDPYDFPYEGRLECWRHAKPLTPEELAKMLK